MSNYVGRAHFDQEDIRKLAETLAPSINDAYDTSRETAQPANRTAIRIHLGPARSVRRPSMP